MPTVVILTIQTVAQVPRSAGPVPKQTRDSSSSQRKQALDIANTTINDAQQRWPRQLSR
jgi:hypothetical protein